MSSHVGEDKTKGPRGVWKCLILKPWKSLFHKTCIYQAVQSACRHVPKASSIATVHPAQILVFPYLKRSKPSRVEFLRWFVRLSCQRSFPWKLFGTENVFIPLSTGPIPKKPHSPHILYAVVVLPAEETLHLQQTLILCETEPNRQQFNLWCSSSSSTTTKKHIWRHLVLM